MSATEKRTFSLPAEQAAFIDRLVESGAYATSSEVIRAGLSRAAGARCRRRALAARGSRADL